MRLNFTLYFIFLSIFSFGQPDELTVESVLNHIYDSQMKNDPFYNDGLFEVKRTMSTTSDVDDDNTLFYPALVAITLKSVYDNLSKNEKIISDSIIARVNRNSGLYKSRNGRASFNFWQTIPPDIPFPNGSPRFAQIKYRLPDDFDDTSIISLAREPNDSLDRAVRDLMSSYVAREGRPLMTSTFKEYQDSKAYEVWFADKYPQDFDICAITNILLFTHRRGFNFNKYDSASIDLIKKMILNKHHLSDPTIISPFYRKTASILYHVTRLMDELEVGYFDEIKPIIIEDLKKHLDKSKNELEKVLVYSSLYRLGVEYPVEIDEDKLRKDISSYPYFSANLPMSIFWKKMIGNTFLARIMHWQCDAFNWTLVLEFLILTSYQGPEE